MIIRMTRVRIAGPRSLLDATLRLLQDLEVVHVVRPAIPGTHPLPPDGEARRLRRILDDAEAALRSLKSSLAAPGKAPAVTIDLPRSAALARRTRRKAERIALALSKLEDERLVLLRYQEFLSAFEPLLDREITWPDGHAFYVVLRAGAGDAVQRLRASLAAAVDGELELFHLENHVGRIAAVRVSLGDRAKGAAAHAAPGADDTMMRRARTRVVEYVRELPPGVGQFNGRQRRTFVKPQRLENTVRFQVRIAANDQIETVPSRAQRCRRSVLKVLAAGHQLHARQPSSNFFRPRTEAPRAFRRH